MDLKELITFRTIIQEGNFTKAATKLNYAQSTITNQVQRLEKEMGIQLFKRGWDAELTASGQIFAVEIDKLIQHWNQVTEQAKALQREEIGSLRIGGLASIFEHVLPSSLQQFQELKPKVACHFVSGNTDSLSRAVLQNQLDFAICGEPTDFSSFSFEPLYNESISFIVANNHPLAERNGIISFEELLNYQMIVGGNTCLYYLRLAKQYSHYTETPFLYTVNQISAIPSFVQRIPSVGAVLDSTALPTNVVKIHVELKDSAIPVGLLQLRNTEYNSSSKNLFMQYVKENSPQMIIS